MDQLKLTMAGARYAHVAAVMDGTVKPKDIDLRVEPDQEYIDRQRRINNGEFDVCECFTGTYIADLPFRELGYKAIPVYPARIFRHSCIHINRKSGIQKPSDLNGKRVAIRFWNISAGLWIKGMLAEDHGVDIASITWVTTLPVFISGWSPPSWLKLEMAPEGKTEYDLLAAGDVLAAITAELWPVDIHPDITYLFPDYIEREKDYYERTKCVPIMHTLIVRSKVLDQHPWVARSLFDAWQASAELYHRTLPPNPPLHAPSPPHHRGSPSIHVHGFKRTRHEVDRLLGYAHKQGVTTRKYDPEELFPESMLET